MDKKRKRAGKHRSRVHKLDAHAAKSARRGARVSGQRRNRGSAGEVARRYARREQELTAWNQGPFVLERFGVVDEIAEKNKLMLDFDYTAGDTSLDPGESKILWKRRIHRLTDAAYRMRKRGPSAHAMFVALRIVGVGIREMCYRRTRKGWHVILRLQFYRTFSAAEIVALQFCLGSDRRRETLNLMRVLSMRNKSEWERQRFNLLFREKIV